MKYRKICFSRAEKKKKKRSLPDYHYVEHRIEIMNHDRDYHIVKNSPQQYATLPGYHELLRTPHSGCFESSQKMQTLTWIRWAFSNMQILAKGDKNGLGKIDAQKEKYG